MAVAATEEERKPNIVLVLMDNFGYGDVGVYGGGVLRGAPTPNIDGIAAEGFQLTNYNVEAECTPSRAALMTVVMEFAPDNDKAVLPGGCGTELPNGR